MHNPRLQRAAQMAMLRRRQTVALRELTKAYESGDQSTVAKARVKYFKSGESA